MKPDFPYDVNRTAIAIAYKNAAYIADLVLPRVQVGKREFKYRVFPIAEGFTIPNTLYPKYGRPNEVKFTSEEVTESVRDWGLDDIVSNDDVANAPEKYDPIAFSVQSLTDLVMLDREVRAAELLFSPSSYASDKIQTLSGTSQFSDFANSDPLGVLIEAMDTCLIRPNTLTIGRKAWSVLMRHPKIVKAVHANAGDSGIASREAVKELLELQNLYIGESRLNTAKKGEEVTLKRVWGNNIALTYINPLANTQSGITFGFTATYGTKVAGSADTDRGIRGAKRVRSAESCVELIVAKETGFLLQNVIA